MPIQFTSDSLVPVSAPAARLATAVPLATLMIAPVDLTPLVPPASAPSPTLPAVMKNADFARETRQPRFVERQRALLERLQQGNATATTTCPGHTLSEAQRQACVSVIATVAAAVVAR
jgi:hypothetical protein